jgi:hypothetical protein
MTTFTTPTWYSPSGKTVHEHEVAKRFRHCSSRLPYCVIS